MLCLLQKDVCKCNLLVKLLITKYLNSEYGLYMWVAINTLINTVQLGQLVKH